MLVLLDFADEVRVAVGDGVVALKVVPAVVVVGVSWFPPTPVVAGIMVTDMPLAAQRSLLRSNISERRIRLYLPIEIVSGRGDLTLLIRLRADPWNTRSEIIGEVFVPAGAFVVCWRT